MAAAAAATKIGFETIHFCLFGHNCRGIITETSLHGHLFCILEEKLDKAYLGQFFCPQLEFQTDEANYGRNELETDETSSKWT